MNKKLPILFIVILVGMISSIVMGDQADFTEFANFDTNGFNVTNTGNAVSQVQWQFQIINTSIQEFQLRGVTILAFRNTAANGTGTINITTINTTSGLPLNYISSGTFNYSDLVPDFTPSNDTRLNISVSPVTLLNDTSYGIVFTGNGTSAAEAYVPRQNTTMTVPSYIATSNNQGATWGIEQGRGLFVALYGVNTTGVVLEFPPTNHFNATNDQTFRCSYNDTAFDITNVTFDLFDSADAIEATTFRDLGSDDRLENETFTVSSLADDAYQWNCIYTNTNNDINIQPTNNTLTIDTTVPQSQLLLPRGIFPSTTGIPLNFTVNDSTSLTCRFSLDGGLSNTTLGSCGNTTFAGSIGDNTLDFYVIDNALNEVTNQTNFSVIDIANLTNPLVLERIDVEISLFVINGSSILTLAELTYNNTVHTRDSVISNGTGIFINKTISTELVNTTSRRLNQTFHWNLTFLTDGASSNISTTISNQTIFQIFIGNETNAVTNVQTLNFTVRNEETDALVNASIQTAFTLRPEAGSNFTRTYNFNLPNNGTVNDSRVAYTIFPQWANLSADYLLQYSASGFVTREFSVLSDLLTNITRNINLSIPSAGSTTEITINVEDEGGSVLEGVVVQAQKKNIGDGTFDNVATQTTNPDGKAFFNLITGENFYRFVFVIAGEVKLTTTDFKLDETEYFFILLLGDPSGIAIENQLNTIISTLQFNISACHNVTFEWNDPNLLGTEFVLNVFNVSFSNGTVLTSTQTSALSAGSLSFSLVPGGCDAPNGTFLAQSFVRLDSDSSLHQLNSLLVELIDRIAESIQRDGLLFSLLIVGTMFGVGAATGNPTAFIVMGIVGLWVVVLPGWLSLSTGAIVTLAALAIIYVRYLKT